ncbi:hypothetical protein FACS1894140_4800 [Spirochaetia bacterium]|nr:hypothetical protein FACS1894140_4800 [Spirochaetia bacterium]
MTFSVIFSGASLVLCGFFFIYFSLYIKRRTERANILEDYQDEVHKLIADIDSATDRDVTLVEDRITTLKQLLEDVDKRIAVLSREQDRRRSVDTIYSSLGRQMKVTVQEPAAPVVLPEPVPERPAPAAVPAVDAGGSKASFAERVAELSRAGFAPDLIAARLGVSLSEVELAIAVSRRKA